MKILSYQNNVTYQHTARSNTSSTTETGVGWIRGLFGGGGVGSIPSGCFGLRFDCFLKKVTEQFHSYLESTRKQEQSKCMNSLLCCSSPVSHSILPLEVPPLLHVIKIFSNVSIKMTLLGGGGCACVCVFVCVQSSHNDLMEITAVLNRYIIKTTVTKGSWY